MSGYVRIHRSLAGHPAFRNESETMAFAWMVMKAAWRQTRVRYKGHSITLKRGQLAISQRDMAAAFDRDKAWIERLWKRCKSEAMIETSTEAGVAVITICNYDEYQCDTDEREAAGKASREAANEAAARQRRGTEQRREEGKKETTDKSVVSRASRGARLPDDFEMPEDWLQWAMDERHWSADDARAEAANFSDFWHSKSGKDASKIDWRATWRVWVRNSRRPGVVKAASGWDGMP